jgi:signal transduction histidine kinase
VLKSFSESLANQILNPVNNLYGRLQLLQNQLQDNPEFGRSFLTIETQVLRIQEIIMRLLTFAQLREDTIPRLLSVNEHVQLFLRQQGLPKQLAEAGVKLGLELVEPLPAISGFAHQIQIMLEMLGSMIIRHLRPGDELKIVTRKAENGLHRSVVQFIIHIVYNNKVSTGIIRNYWRDGTQYTRFGSIETIITQSIINAFHGQWQVVSEDESVESLIIEFPARA